MYADIGILILFWMKIIIVFASALAGLIFGILIASNKVKSTKVLGIGIIISAAASIVSNAHNFLIRYVNIEVYARYATLSSIVTLIATFTGAICTCVFKPQMGLQCPMPWRNPLQLRVPWHSENKPADQSPT